MYAFIAKYIFANVFHIALEDKFKEDYALLFQINIIFVE